jgi:hypothetical protein
LSRGKKTFPCLLTYTVWLPLLHRAHFCPVMSSRTQFIVQTPSMCFLTKKPSILMGRRFPFLQEKEATLVYSYFE